MVNRKSIFKAYIFWFFLGFFGAHRLYVRHYLRGILMGVAGILLFVVILAGDFIHNLPITNDLLSPIVVTILGWHLMLYFFDFFVLWRSINRAPESFSEEKIN